MPATHYTKEKKKVLARAPFDFTCSKLVGDAVQIGKPKWGLIVLRSDIVI